MMSLNFDPIYLVWLFIAISAGLAFEAVYLLGFSKTSYRSTINRRLSLSKDRPDRESVLVQLRRERGLTSGGNYRLTLVSLSRLMLQSARTMAFTRLLVILGLVSLLAFAATMVFRGSVIEAAIVAVFCAS